MGLEKSDERLCWGKLHMGWPPNNIQYSQRVSEYSDYRLGESEGRDITICHFKFSILGISRGSGVTLTV